MESPGTTDMNFPTNPKLDYFRRDIVDTYLSTYGFGSLPTTFSRIKQYINDATLTLMGADIQVYLDTQGQSQSSYHPICHRNVGRRLLRPGGILGSVNGISRT